MEKIYRAGNGTPQPLGTSIRGENRINFALFSSSAKGVTLLLHDKTRDDQVNQPVEIRLDPADNRSGDIWHVEVAADPAAIRYGYRISHKDSRADTPVLIDPYCRQLTARTWNSPSQYGTEPLCEICGPDNFDWQGDRPLNRPASETIIYELHIRGYTRHRSSGVTAPGTYLGLIEKIPYLKELGVTAVELLPITEWDETDNHFSNPETGEQLLNYWGYNPLNFFALKSGFAANPADHINEFKTMVRTLHQAGIEVILDVVYNHTGEGDENGTITSLKGIDNEVYYLTDSQNGAYANFSGCGNSVNCNHPVVQDVIIESLKYWVETMHVDGFRFDLASVLTRGMDGEILEQSPLIQRITHDPLLKNTKLIAEPWDAAGLYQVGSFSTSRRWREWNGKFRDDLRRFLANHPDTVRNLATRVAGSSDLYDQHDRSPLSSVNFITSHDGFTLYDLVSYSHKQNRGNGEENRDGENHNMSWNSGYEGDPAPPKIMQMRCRRIKTFTALLLLSQGIPMITAGDEFFRSQKGNNNSWCQDNEIGWVDWSFSMQHADMIRFVTGCITVRRRNTIFRRDRFFTQADDSTEQTISWQSLIPGQEDWTAACRTLAFHLSGTAPDPDFFIMVNGSPETDAHFTVPTPRNGATTWNLTISTAAAPPHDFIEADGPVHKPDGQITVSPMGLIVLQAQPRSTWQQ